MYNYYEFYSQNRSEYEKRVKSQAQKYAQK